MNLRVHGREIVLPQRPLVMGILNLGADSFSGDGIPAIDSAVARAREMISEGADIIDVGAESARTNRGAVPEEEEAAQLCRFIERWPEVSAAAPEAQREFPLLLSLNTWRPEVAKRALGAGGDLLNDIGGLPTPANAQICAEAGAALVIMHTVGEPKVPHTHIHYPDVIETVSMFFEEKIALACGAGLDRSAIVLDPGIDFAKQRDDNLRIYRELAKFTRFGCPILLPVSRKTVIGDALGLPDPRDRDAGTVACIAAGVMRGARIFRVHNVRAAAQSVRILTAVER